LPAFFISFARAARRAAGDADIIHAHWLPSGLVALATAKSFVVQLWGTDVELARRAPWLFRPILRRARIVIAASEYLAEAARRLGARDVRVIPAAIEIPRIVREPDEPPHVLFVGRLSAEKGIHEFLAATDGLPRVIVGAGPIDVPEAVGFVPREELGAYYERAAVVCVPSRREGYGVVAREAMAHGRPVVATAVGGLVDAVEDGQTGVLVPAEDVAARRAALERQLVDRAQRARVARAARNAAAAQHEAAAVTLAKAYRHNVEGR
jgi:glycosyltransferase involved in cell wall biosynthesis